MSDINLGYIHMSSYRKGEKIFPDDCDPEEVENNLPNEIILKPNFTFKLIINYPLDNPFVTEFKTKRDGMTRRQVIEFIIKCYKQIYEEEEKSAKTEIGNIPGMFNRNKTDGKYGIWGHDLSDLMLHTLVVEGNKLEVICDS